MNKITEQECLTLLKNRFGERVKVHLDGSVTILPLKWKKAIREDGQVIDVYFMEPFNVGAICMDVAENEYVVESYTLSWEAQTIHVCSKLEFLKNLTVLSLRAKHIYCL